MNPPEFFLWPTPVSSCQDTLFPSLPLDFFGCSACSFSTCLASDLLMNCLFLAWSLCGNGLDTASRMDFDVEGERRGGGVLLEGEKSCCEKIGAVASSLIRGAGAFLSLEQHPTTSSF